MITIQKDHVRNDGAGKVAQVNFKMDFHGFEVSVVIDDSCGRFDYLWRGTILVSDENDVDVTARFISSDALGGEVEATSENLFSVMKAIEQAATAG